MSMMINTAADLIAEHCSRHIRITHAIAQGQMDRAADLLRTRMRGFVQGWHEGDIVEDEDLAFACSALTNSHGPIVLREITRASQEECERIRHA